ncbi:MAG: Hsp20/alpha crystallin family protein [Acidobacteriota bacterium]|nr:Hsp20/alpha crystallin family protein [Acidobacteriota bacterium]
MSLLLKHRPKNVGLARESLLEDPFRLLREANRWDPFQDLGLRPLGKMETFMPAFDLKETPTEFSMKADLPGIKEDDLDISVSGNRLTISGKREEEIIHDDEICHAYERTFGSFSRAVTLPEDVDANKVNAQLKDGVLSVTIPKSPEIRPRKVEVKTS